MISFFNRNKELINNFPFNVDVHAHLIPGIDDGPATMEESIRMIEKLAKIGYKRLTATPHVFSEYYPNTNNTILTGFKQLQTAVSAANIDIILDVAAEYFLEEDFLIQLHSTPLLTINDNQLLVEMSTFGAPPNLKEMILQIKAYGYQPILAHPERYLYLEETDYLQLLELGCTFQINLLSSTGYYGKNVQQRALKLIKKGWVHHIGTDAHSETQVDLITEFTTIKPLYTYVSRFIQPLRRAGIF